MKNDLDMQLQHQWTGELVIYAEKCSTIMEYLYKSCLRALHTTSVAQTVAGYEHNKVLNTTAPELDSSEIDLPRKAHTFLAQLRSGYCARLNSCKHRLNSAVHNSCPDCNMTPHSVAHLFVCPMHRLDQPDTHGPLAMTQGGRWVPQRLTWTRWRVGYYSNNNTCSILTSS